MSAHAVTAHKLIYFDFAGKAEAIRLALTHAGVAFEDYRFADRAEFAALKASGRLQFGQVPALEVVKDGQTTVLTQSAAILRYVAKLSPDAINKEVTPRHLSNLAKMLDAGGSGWLAGTPEPSIADFVWGPVMKSISAGWTGDENALAAFPSLKAWHGRFRAIPSVGAYYAPN